MRTKIGMVSTALIALVWLALPATQAARGGFCGYTAFEAVRGCRNGAWDDFHVNRGKCINNAERDVRTACLSANSKNVRSVLEECEEQFEARLDVCDQLGQRVYDPPFEPEDFVDPDMKGAVGNPFLSLEAGKTSVVRAAGGEELVIVHVTSDVKIIEGVPCRVVVDVGLEVGVGDDDDDGDDDEAKRGAAAVEYVPLEVTDDWYAQHVNGDIWYCGELSRNYEDGELADLDGSFTAGQDGAKPGVLIRANPIVGEIYRQEFALGDAEDLADVVALDASPEDKSGLGFACDGQCLETHDFSPLEPEVDEQKFYLADVGFVLAIGFEDGEEEDREVLICTGDSLDVLADPACGIENLDELLELLCELHPDAFCADPEDDQE